MSQTQKLNPLDIQIGGDHYKDLCIQPAEYAYKNKLSSLEGSIIKYITRWRKKGGFQDLEKAKHLIDMIIQFEEEMGNAQRYSVRHGNNRTDEATGDAFEQATEDYRDRLR